MQNIFFKEQHQYELSRRDRLHRDISLPIAVTIALLGGWVSLFGKIRWPFDFLEWVILVVLMVAVPFILKLIWLLDKVSRNNLYEYLATSDEIDRYKKQLKANAESKKQLDAGWSDKFETFIEEEYIRCSTANAITNDKRSERLDDARRYILFSAIVLFIGFFADAVKNTFFGSEINEQKQVFIMADENENTGQSDNNESQQPTPPPAQENNPTPPPGRTVRDSTPPKQK